MVLLMPEKCIEGHLRSSTTSESWKSCHMTLTVLVQFKTQYKQTKPDFIRPCPGWKLLLAKFVFFSILYKVLAKELNMSNKSCSQIKISLAKLINFSKWLKWQMTELALLYTGSLGKLSLQFNELTLTNVLHVLQRD